MIDVAHARAETPGCARDLIHFNNAGCALPPRCVVDAVGAHLAREAEIGGYEAADEAASELSSVYAGVARLLNAAVDEIAVVENATRAWDMAFYALRLGPGDRILTGAGEYASNAIAFLHQAARTGALIEVVPDDEDGQTSPTALAGMIDDRVKLIAITHVPSNGGLVNPAAAIGAVARGAGIPFLLDACQSAGQLPLDVQAIGCTMLSATGRKFLRGPRGTGFLYVRRDWIERLDPPFLDLHAATWTAADRYVVRADARRFENWESFVAGKLGLGAAVDYALGLGMEAIANRVGSLAASLRDRLAALPGVTVRDKGRERCGIVTFTLDRASASDVKRRLAAQRMNVSVSPASYARYDMDARGLTEIVRASVHYYNTEDEIDRFCTALTRR